MDVASRLQEILGSTEFPQQLISKYPHLAERLILSWGSPALDIFLNELFFDRRGGRQGFEPEIMHELFSIQSLHNKLFPHEDHGVIWTEDNLAPEDLRADYVSFDPPHLMEAAKTANLGMIKDALASGFPINSTDDDGLTMLWWAARYGHRELIITLLKARARIDIVDERGCGPVHWLASQDIVSAIEELHQHGADLDLPDNDGVTPLMYAAKRGRVAAAGCLLQAGVAVNAQDNKGMTALHYAAENASGRMLELLLVYDADPKLMDFQSRTAEDIVRQKPDALRLLAYLM
ncbi:ankyrin repeat domain-containing protein [Chitinibacter bivalviorum]|uniref:Ankyrin repeat domain-containing protein n=1 Tax=Chitinibacter bivalviorum TaxID=2739434 RepID=A0A7H9BIF2_9NEIS|nr:ankyrin repeat domain-containing protein [Chitinibacter bivalviorum]QLG88503.1 ankyrin repeat domain-containing protein [Chitinibacter bivalviorum]